MKKQQPPACFPRLDSFCVNYSFDHIFYRLLTYWTVSFAERKAFSIAYLPKCDRELCVQTDVCVHLLLPVFIISWSKLHLLFTHQGLHCAA